MKKLKIAGSIFYGIVTLPLLIILFSAMPQLLGEDIGWNALGGVILMVYTSIIALALYIIPITIGIIGLCKNKKVIDLLEAKRNKRYFVLMIVLPLLTTVINFTSYYLLIIF